jgi:hypothetical protein
VQECSVNLLNGNPVERNNTIRRLIRRAAADAGVDLVKLGRHCGYPDKRWNLCLTDDDDHSVKLHDLPRLCEALVLFAPQDRKDAGQAAARRLLDEAFLHPLGLHAVEVRAGESPELDAIRASVELHRESSEASAAELAAAEDGMVTPSEAARCAREYGDVETKAAARRVHFEGLAKGGGK